MSFRRILHYAAWPTAAGLSAALLALVLIPELRRELPNINPTFLSAFNGPKSGPVSYADAVDKAAPAVVNIYTRKKLRSRRHPLFDDPIFRLFYNRFDLPQQERLQSTLGSGVIMSEEGYLLTNNHVIDRADEIVVMLADGREARASIIGSDRETDLAVLKIDLPDLSSAVAGNPNQARVGDVVLAIGNPFGVGQTVTQGIVSATARHAQVNRGRNPNEIRIPSQLNYIQTDAPIYPGSSGGALINAQGELLGINTLILDRPDYSVGIGFAIPVDRAMTVLEDIIAFGRAVRGWLGIEARPLSPQLAKSLRLDSTEGVLITAIESQGPAHHAGLRPGDVITRINQLAVGPGLESLSLIAQTRPGDSVELEIWRNGITQVITATVGAAPKQG